MITSADTSVLSDILFEDPVFQPRSVAALQKCLEDGKVVVCDVVVAELSSAMREPRDALIILAELGISFDPSEARVALLAGEAWKHYRERGGPRQRLVPDFLVASHAFAQCDRLLTRDPRVPRSYFPDLVLLEP